MKRLDPPLVDALGSFDFGDSTGFIEGEIDPIP
jgi:hypothetical protein